MEYSIVTALYNGLDYTKAFLKSLDETMKGRDYELILVDDGSTDGTREFLETLYERPNTRIRFNEENLGFARSNNLGVGGARGKYLLLLNNDIVLTPGWLEPMRAALTQEHKWMGHSRKAGVVGNIQRRASDYQIDHAGIYFSIYTTPAHAFRQSNYAPKAAYTSWIAATAACWLVETEYFRSLGGFDERYVNGMEDVDFCLQSAEQGRIAVVANESIIQHAVSASRKVSLEDENNYRKLWEKWRYPLHELAAVDQARYKWLEAAEFGSWQEKLRYRLSLKCALPLWRSLEDRAAPFTQKPKNA